jgi:peroxiredoxin
MRPPEATQHQGASAAAGAHGDHHIGVRVGDPAPDFALPDQDNVEFRLSDWKGKRPVVLLFYPLDWSPTCSGENACWTRDHAELSRFAEVAAISVDSVWSHRAFAKQLGLKHRMLSDMHRAVCRAYGVLIEPVNFSQRATVAVSTDGTVAWYKVQSNPSEARDHEELLQVLRALK